MLSIGVPVYASSLYGLLAMSALIPVVLNRIGMEERILTAKFRDAYRRYMDSTKKLIPFINTFAKIMSDSSNCLSCRDLTIWQSDN